MPSARIATSRFITASTDSDAKSVASCDSWSITSSITVASFERAVKRSSISDWSRSGEGASPTMEMLPALFWKWCDRCCDAVFCPAIGLEALPEAGFVAWSPIAVQSVPDHSLSCCSAWATESSSFDLTTCNSSTWPTRNCFSKLWKTALVRVMSPQANRNSTYLMTSSTAVLTTLNSQTAAPTTASTESMTALYTASPILAMKCQTAAAASSTTSTIASTPDSSQRNRSPIPTRISSPTDATATGAGAAAYSARAGAADDETLA